MGTQRMPTSEGSPLSSQYPRLGTTKQPAGRDRKGWEIGAGMQPSVEAVKFRWLQVVRTEAGESWPTGNEMWATSDTGWASRPGNIRSTSPWWGAGRRCPEASAKRFSFSSTSLYPPPFLPLLTTLHLSLFPPPFFSLIFPLLFLSIPFFFISILQSFTK